MNLFSSIKHYLYVGLREVLVYHHNSLEFRAKVFAMIIAANPHASKCEYNLVQEAGLKIYKDIERVEMLVTTTREYVKKVTQEHGLNIDDLALDIQRELQEIPRYALKIDINALHPIAECSIDEDISTYQIRIIEFLEKLKEDFTKDE